MEIVGAQAGQSESAQKIARGVRRMLIAGGWTTLDELRLANGRRADIAALSPTGFFHIIEIKSSVADFRADKKWRDYRDYCDTFSFAIDLATPQELIPEDVGLILADAFFASVIRAGVNHPLSPARRRAMLLRFAKVAADRLYALRDPEARSSRE